MRHEQPAIDLTTIASPLALLPDDVRQALFEADRAGAQLELVGDQGWQRTYDAPTEGGTTYRVSPDEPWSNAETNETAPQGAAA